MAFSMLPCVGEDLNGVRFEHAVVYCYDSYQDPRGVAIIHEDSRLHHGVIRKFTTRLDAEGIQLLKSSFRPEHAARRALGYNDASHAIVFYDAEWNHVGWIVCELAEGRILCHPKNLVTHFDLAEFKQMMTRAEVPILESQQAYRHHFKAEAGELRFEGEDPAKRPYISVLRPVVAVPDGFDASRLSSDVSYGYSSENPIVLAREAVRSDTEIVEEFLRKISSTSIGNPVSFYRSPRKLDAPDTYCYTCTAWLDATIELWIHLADSIESEPKAPTGLLFWPAKEPTERQDPHDRNRNAQQDGTGQPATRPELKSEGSDKPQPESEGRSR